MIKWIGLAIIYKNAIIDIFITINHLLESIRCFSWILRRIFNPLGGQLPAHRNYPEFAQDYHTAVWIPAKVRRFH